VTDETDGQGNDTVGAKVPRARALKRLAARRSRVRLQWPREPRRSVGFLLGSRAGSGSGRTGRPAREREIVGKTSGKAYT